MIYLVRVMKRFDVARNACLVFHHDEGFLMTGVAVITNELCTFAILPVFQEASLRMVVARSGSRKPSIMKPARGRMKNTTNNVTNAAHDKPRLLSLV